MLMLIFACLSLLTMTVHLQSLHPDLMFDLLPSLTNLLCCSERSIHLRVFFYNVGKIKQIKQIEVSMLINEQVFSAESS